VRVLHVISTLGVGGAETVAIELARQHAYRHQIAVLTLFAPAKCEHAVATERRRQLADAGVVVYEGKRRKRLEAVTAALRIQKVVRRWRPDIVHSHTDLPDFSVALARRVRRFAICRTIHNTELWATRPRSAWLVEAAIHADLVVAINSATEAAYRVLRNRTGQPASPYIQIIPNGIPVLADEDYATRADLVRLLGANPERVQFGFVGRLEPQKGIDLLLAAIVALPEELLARFQLHVIGEGTLGPDVIAAQLLLPDVIRPHGSLASPRRLLRGFDAIVIPSRFEGMPLIGIEARLSGTATIISDAPGLRQLFPADWPWLVAAGDQEQLSVALTSLLSHSTTLSLKMDCTTDWSSDAMAARYLAAYQSYLAERG
jgi:glycosyltransferase involved in cell wall biosynthesis